MSGQEKLEFKALQWSDELRGAVLEIAPDGQKQEGAIAPGADKPLICLAEARRTHSGGGTVASTISIARKLIFSNQDFLDQTLPPFVST
jgi:hypothetical protein